MKYKVAIIILALVIPLACLVSYRLGEVVSIDQTAVTESIEFLEDCRAIHQEYIDRPEFCNDQTGYVEHHENLVDKYNQVIGVLEAIK